MYVPFSGSLTTLMGMIKCKTSYSQSPAHSTRSGGKTFGRRSWVTTRRRRLLANLLPVSYLYKREPPSIISVDACGTYNVHVCVDASKLQRPSYAVRMSSWNPSEKSRQCLAKWATKNRQKIRCRSNRTHCSPCAGHASPWWPSSRWSTTTSCRKWRSWRWTALHPFRQI
ncbi:hypothetical protein BGY98DRAFT_987922 [Russula aff. rugulosa BPL654]|nr:hypothetical protein BGY98DRAFT_987922 [Russula aff. rugulosa BPL654]